MGLSINSHPLGIEVAGELTETQQDGLRDVLDQLLRGRAAGPPAVLTHPVLIGTGTNPSADPAGVSPNATSIERNSEQ